MAEADSPGTSSHIYDDGTPKLRFQFGSVVAAKLGNFPWWPAMVDPSLETNEIHSADGSDNSEDPICYYHVVFFDVPGKVTRNWVQDNKILPYKDFFSKPLTQSERDAVSKLRGAKTKRRLVEARSIAEAALRIPIEQRREKYSFIHTFKGRMTITDEDGNKQVIGGRNAEQKVEPLRLRLKLTTEPKQQSSNGSDVSKSRKRRASSTSSSATLPPDNPPTSENSCATSATRNSSPASHISIEPNGRREKRRWNSAPIPPISPPSSVPMASQELAQELSVFAASFPVEETSTKDDMPKKRGSKRKQKDEANQPTNLRIRKLRSSKIMPAPEAFICLDTPSVSETTTNASSPTSSVMPVYAHCSQDPGCPRSTPSSPSATLPEEPEGTQVSIKEQSVPLVDQDLVPSENSLETRMTSFLNRIQKQKPNLKSNGKTISNINHLISETEEARVVDLTGDDDDECPWKTGDVVLANLKGLRPWPAVIIMDREINLSFIPKTGAPNYVHVLFIHINRRAWVPVENVSTFEDMNLHTKEVDMFNYDNYICAYDMARKACLHPRDTRTRLFGDMMAVPMTGMPDFSDDVIIP